MDYELIETPFNEVEATGRMMSGRSTFLIPPPEHGRSFCVVDRNERKTAYFWPEKSPALLRLKEAAKSVGFPHPVPSWARVSKHICAELVCPINSGIRPNRIYTGLADSKFHWHCMKAVPGVYKNITEIDIKSAYATAIGQNPSLFLASPGNWKDDGGAIENFRAISSSLNKNMRLAFVGFLAQYKLNYWQKSKADPSKLEHQTLYHSHDGGIFNMIHYSLFKLYQLMQEIGDIGGEFCPRIHTDSFWIDERIPTARLKKIFKLLDDNGYQYTCKGHGRAHLFDLNSAILNGHLIGIPARTLSRWEKQVSDLGDVCFEVEKLDKRFEHLPYRNERFSVRQMKTMPRYNKSAIIIPRGIAW